MTAVPAAIPTPMSFCSCCKSANTVCSSANTSIGSAPSYSAVLPHASLGGAHGPAEPVFGPSSVFSKSSSASAMACSILCPQGVLGSLVQSEYLRHTLRLVQRVGRSRVQRHNPGGQTGHLGERERCSPLVAPALLHPVIGPEADEKGGQHPDQHRNPTDHPGNGAQ